MTLKRNQVCVLSTYERARDGDCCTGSFCLLVSVVNFLCVPVARLLSHHNSFTCILAEYDQPPQPVKMNMSRQASHSQSISSHSLFSWAFVHQSAVLPHPTPPSPPPNTHSISSFSFITRHRQLNCHVKGADCGRIRRRTQIRCATLIYFWVDLLTRTTREHNLHRQIVWERVELPLERRRKTASFSYTQWLFDCYLFQVPKGQGRYSAGLVSMKPDICWCWSHSLRKSRLNMKLYK